MKKIIDQYIIPGKSGDYKQDDERLYSIPRTNKTSSKESAKLKNQIPFLFLRNGNTKANNLILYFHGRSEKISSLMKNLKKFNKALNSSSAIIEYSGYGVLKNLPISPQQMLKDSTTIYKFFTDEIGYSPKNIIIIGRSLGSGPATYLASKIKNCKMLLLISPFTGLLDVLDDKCIYRFAKWIFNYKTEHFDNLKHIKNVSIPVFMVHGQEDNIIKADHTKALYEACSSKTLEASLPPKMSHSRIDIKNHILKPVKEFIKNSIESKQSDLDKYNEINEKPDLEKLKKFKAIRYIKLKKKTPTRQQYKRYKVSHH
jgi:esterase/lipase